MIDKENNKPHLFLVTPLNGSKDEIGEEKIKQPKGKVQLTLFPEHIGPTVIYVHLTEDNINKVVDGLQSKVVHSIIDIREAPYLSFSDFSREKFLSILSQVKAEYINIHKLMRNKNIETVKEYMSIISDNSLNNDDGTLELVNVIKSGPVFVFTDREPEKDNLIKSFEMGLRLAELDFTASCI